MLFSKSIDESNGFKSLLHRYRAALSRLEESGVRVAEQCRLRSYETRLSQLLIDPRSPVPYTPSASKLSVTLSGKGACVRALIFGAKVTGCENKQDALSVLCAMTPGELAVHRSNIQSNR